MACFTKSTEKVLRVQYSLAILDVRLESSFRDKVVLDSFSLMSLPGPSGVCRPYRKFTVSSG